MENMQDNLKKAGFDKILNLDERQSIMNHFLIKILEKQKIDPILIDELYKQVYS